MIAPKSALLVGSPAGERHPSARPGLYAYYLLEPLALKPIVVDPSRPIYVGMTESSLDVRCHFGHRHSGYSTFRRSLGAIMKEQLRLVALPRSPGPSLTNLTCYRFNASGETRLTEWMVANLRYAQLEVDADIRETERRLIALWEPVLNLTGWRNPQRAMIKALRARCVSEARAGGRATPVSVGAQAE